MSGSLMVAAKDALVATLPTRPGLAGVQVQYSDEVETARRERIFMGDVDENDHEPVALKSGRRRREETFTLQVFVEVSRGRTARDAETRALTIVQEVEEALADDPTLGAVPGLAWAQVAGMRMSTTTTNEGPRTLVEMRVTVKGRLL